jgi:hypothetical protein
MGFRRTDRLSDLMKLKTLILKTCSACGHQALFNPADVLQYLAADREVGALPFRCNCCGSGFVLEPIPVEPFPLRKVCEINVF